MKRSRLLVFLSIALFGLAWGVQADPPTEIDYQGKILVNDIPLTADGFFKYAISDEAATTNYWSQDGTTTGEPTGFVTNACYNGVFSAALGASPMTAIDPDIFAAGADLVLRVWFSSDGITFNEMLPSQELLSSPYAINADLLDGLHAADIISLSTNGYSEVDPVFTASDAFGITSAAMANWNTAFGWGNHASYGYLTTEVDPVWTAASNLYHLATEADAKFVDETGDIMTGALTLNVGAGNDLEISSAGTSILIGNSALAGVGGVAVGSSADGTASGVAVGYQADGNTSGAAVGYQADGSSSGAAVGYQADANSLGSAVGYQADGSSSGVAVGRGSSGVSWGAAVGANATADWYGVAMGRAADGKTNGIAIGYGADGSVGNIAIGEAADAQMGTERIAIGHNVTNGVDNSASLRGALYMDGGTAIYGRTSFATGAFEQLLPLPPLDNVVYVATNGTLTGPGTMDRPFDSPQTGYSYAATHYLGQPATLVIAAGQHLALNMNAGNVHVIGQSRAELASLTVSAAANSIQGKQRVENLIVMGMTVVAADLGEDVKFHNCRFEFGLNIYGPNVEVQDCFAMGMDAAAVNVGDGINNITDIALTQSSFLTDSGLSGALVVNQGVANFEVIGCQIMNKAPFASIEDFETGPISPVHLYTHNYIGGVAAAIAVQDPLVGMAGPTIAFTQNTVLGGVGLNGNFQFYANNVVYGLINNVAGPGTPGWLQAGSGAVGLDAAGNTEHELNFPSLPSSWLD